MISFHTKLKIIDNSGVSLVRCIKILGGSKRKTAGVGDIIVVSTQKVKQRSKIKKGKVALVLIVRTKNTIKRKDGTSISFNYNAGVMMTPQKTFMATKIKGPVAEELRKKKYMKVISLASNTL